MEITSRGMLGKVEEYEDLQVKSWSCELAGEKKKSKKKTFGRIWGNGTEKMRRFFLNGSIFYQVSQ